MTDKYHLSQRVLHWLMAVIVISLLFVGLVMTSMPKEAPLRGTLYAMHKSFGVTVLVLCLLRIALRFRFGVPALPDAIAAIERKLALLGHYALYFCMLAMPISGYLGTNSYGRNVVFFGIDLPRVIGADRDFGRLMFDIHQFTGFALIGIICVHVLAVIKHRIKDRVNLLQRMT